MVTVSLTTDWGKTGLYTGVFKAKLVQKLPGVQIVDISHEIDPFKVESAVFSLKNAIPYFSPKTIHVVSVAAKNLGRNAHKNREFICFQHNYQYFIGPNNGLWELLFEKPITDVFKIELPQKRLYSDSFVESDIFVDVISKLALGTGPDRIGERTEFFRGQIFGKPEIGPDEIKGAIMYFDVYGNGVSNVSKAKFEEIRKGRAFSITIGRASITTDEISQDYIPTKHPIIALFNSAGLLELAMPFMSLQSFLNIESQTGFWIRFFETEEAFELK
ncbi:MAG: SAM-dependent chlorinase/fluorinase [Bacteroidales bacterium]|nr:SAM-dependent chlorinase/fluorinase [Bacteroidales bacterium]